MTTHRKPRAGSRMNAQALGVTSAALASAGLLAAPGAVAAPGPERSAEALRAEVDGLYRQAGAATQRYDAARERVAERRDAVAELMAQVARSTEKLNGARRLLGSYAAARYRGGGPVGDTAALLLADDPQGYLAQRRLLDRLGGEQQAALAEYRDRRAGIARQRREAAGGLAELSAAERELGRRKAEVQGKLARARGLLASLTERERERLAEAERAERARREPPGAPEGPPEVPVPGDSRGARAVAFARAQLGKPYVWGATGPNAWDCSGLTRAAWRAAGVELPRTTWEQVEAGPRVRVSELVPGDLVFFYADISHVGIYVGGGRMIHAPRPGAYVREDSIHYQPMYGRVRPRG
ncbi:C40 family peptidase [Streptomyces sp. NPDC097619]|uniref:C40 family peptidase n=1 Tax=Streptomyces sp. NPDC097619 TaxID=3157228 RepID=UPI00332279D9